MIFDQLAYEFMRIIILSLDDNRVAVQYIFFSVDGILSFSVIVCFDSHMLIHQY